MFLAPEARKQHSDSVLLALGLMFAAPVVVGVEIMIGIGDTWLDLRARVDETTA